MLHRNEMQTHFSIPDISSHLERTSRGGSQDISVQSSWFAHMSSAFLNKLKRNKSEANTVSQTTWDVNLIVAQWITINGNIQINLHVSK